ncbi:hypothetical protein COO60DRAFT_1704752 [Scenedesmus sp. NREL 46B-D3]|nr:hypothetical protein COO60DRAFT_1704752 [Scenedesmus sp. NREL 46B-D3]
MHTACKLCGRLSAAVTKMKCIGSNGMYSSSGPRPVTSLSFRPHSSRVLQPQTAGHKQKRVFPCVRSDALAMGRRQVLLVMASTASQQQLAGLATAAGNGTAAGAPQNAAAAAAAQPAAGYKQPPKEILDIVDAPPQPGLTFSPDRTKILQLSRPPSLPPIFDISRPELKLAGVRIDAEQWSPSRMGYYMGLSMVPSDVLVPAAPEAMMEISGHPEGAWLNYVTWSPDGSFIAFTTRSPAWLADTATGKARPLLGPRRLNTVFHSYTWIDDNTLVAATVPAGCGEAPRRPPVPAGPRIQDNSSGKKSQNRTWTDLLRDDHDAELFEYYGTSELVLLDVRQQGSEGEVIAPPRMYTE